MMRWGWLTGILGRREAVEAERQVPVGEVVGWVHVGCLCVSCNTEVDAGDVAIELRQAAGQSCQGCGWPLAMCKAQWAGCDVVVGVLKRTVRCRLCATLQLAIEGAEIRIGDQPMSIICDSCDRLVA